MATLLKALIVPCKLKAKLVLLVPVTETLAKLDLRAPNAKTPLEPSALPVKFNAPSAVKTALVLIPAPVPLETPIILRLPLAVMARVSLRLTPMMVPIAEPVPTTTTAPVDPSIVPPELSIVTFLPMISVIAVNEPLVKLEGKALLKLIDPLLA